MKLRTPYPGLRPFDEPDRPLFFGREAQINGVLNKLEDHAFVAVLGSSGSGKSSLVRAGLLPAVRVGFLMGSANWIIAVAKPGNHPYMNLSVALADALKNHQSGLPKDLPDGDHIQKFLIGSDRGLLDFARQLQGVHLMVVIDQFEELFAFRRATAGRDNVASRDEAAAFVNTLLRATSDVDSRVRVVITMRSDFMGDCEAFLGLPEVISRSQFLVPRLDREEMQEAITRPGRIEEAEFRPFSFEEGLVNHIINDAGDRPDQLPLMQHALMRTWKIAVARFNGQPGILEEKDYAAAGGIQEALSRHAEDAWKRIEGIPEKEDLARRLFLLLCDISPDGQITRRRPTVNSAMESTGASLEAIDEIVRLFQEDDRNFLLPPLAPRGTAKATLGKTELTSADVLDISHEALLRQWPRFSNWQIQERQDASELRRLSDLATLHSQEKSGTLSLLDLVRVADWQRRVSASWAVRYVPKELWNSVNRYVEESRVAARKQEHVRLALYGLLAVTLIIGALASFLLMLRADRAREAAQAALTKGFARTIGTSGTGPISPDEQVQLWELAELDGENDAVRRLIVDEWLASDSGLSRALLGDGRGLRAAVGIGGPTLEYFNQRAKTRVAESIATLLAPSTSPEKQDEVSQSIVQLAKVLLSHDAAEFIHPLLEALKEPAIEKNRALDVQDAVVSLAASINSMPTEGVLADAEDAFKQGLKAPDSQLAAAAARVLALLSDTMDAVTAGRLSRLAAESFASSRQDESLEKLISAITPKIPAADAELAVNTQVRYLEGSLVHDPCPAARSTMRLAARIESTIAAKLAKRLLDNLDQKNPAITTLAAQSSVNKPNPSSTRSMDFNKCLAIAVAGFINRMAPPGATGSVKDTQIAPSRAWATVMKAYLEISDAPDIIEGLHQALVHEAPGLTKLEVSELAKDLVADLKTAMAERIAKSMEILAPRIESQSADRLWESVTDAAIFSADESNRAAIVETGGHLAHAISVEKAKSFMKEVKELSDRNDEEFFAILGERVWSIVPIAKVAAAKLPTKDALELVQSIDKIQSTLKADSVAELNVSIVLSETLCVVAPQVGSGTVLLDMVDQVGKALDTRIKQNWRNTTPSSVGTTQDVKQLVDSLNCIAMQLKPQDALKVVEQRTAEVGAAKDPAQIESLTFIIASLLSRIEPAKASTAAKTAVDAIVNRTDVTPLQLVALARTIPAMLPSLSSADASALAERFVTAEEKSKDRDFNLIDNLTVAVLTLSHQPTMNSKLASRNAAVLLKSLDFPVARSATTQAHIGARLAELSQHISPVPTNLLMVALSSMMLDELPREKSDRVLKRLSTQQLSEVLKWPYCVGPAERLVRAELKQRADSGGKADSGKPAKRPSINAAIQELR